MRFSVWILLLPGLVAAASLGTPFFEEYVGSTLNGDFETGDAAGGIQHWGEHVPWRGSIPDAPAMLGLVTAPDGDGAPVAARSGRKLVSIARGGVAWNLADLASSPTDRLPRVGDLVAGGYWLHVPAGADLAAGVPSVRVIHQSPGGDVPVAEAVALSADSLVKGGWNRIAILPRPGAVIGAGATRIGILVSAPVRDPGKNSMYPSLYYMDDIRVGRVPDGVRFAPGTALAPDPAGRDLRADVVLQNRGAPLRDARLVLQIDEGGAARRVVQPLEIDGAGETGFSLRKTAITIPLPEAGRGGVAARLRLYADAALRVPLSPSFTLLQPMRAVPLSAPEIRYEGRWIDEREARRGNWIRPAFTLGFTRSASVRIRLARPAGLHVRLDGAETSHNTVNGWITLGADLDPGRAHTLRVATLTWRDALVLGAIEIDEGGELLPTAAGPGHIEFIGDSITAWDGGYAWLVPERLGVPASRVAWPGIAVRDGCGYHAVPAGQARLGMVSAYLLDGMPGHGGTGPWDFAPTAPAPNLVVINLGTNDAGPIAGRAGEIAAFQAAFRELLRRVREKRPAAEIFVLRPFSIAHADVQAAILAATVAQGTGDSRMRYVDTSDWGVAPGADGVHPAEAGHVAIAERLGEVLAPYLSRSAP